MVALTLFHSFIICIHNLFNYYYIHHAAIYVYLRVKMPLDFIIYRSQLQLFYETSRIFILCMEYGYFHNQYHNIHCQTSKDEIMY
jgi:hypothetical protein